MSMSKIRGMSLRLFLPKPTSLSTFLLPHRRKALAFFSITSTPYPLQYDLIITRPAGPTTTRPRSRPPRAGREQPGSKNDSDSDIGDWAGKKLSLDNGMDKAKRKYYSKRRRRMYGTDSEEEEERRRREDGFVELKPEVVNFPRLHQREEELYFYDAFAWPWEKDKHYKMVYQLEKKYFPGECLDKAFVGVNDVPGDGEAGDEKGSEKEGDGDGKFVFFGEEEKKGEGEEERGKGKGVAERKVEDLFKTLKRVRKEGGLDGVAGSGGKPFLVKGNGQLPRQWDGPTGTVLLVNKPKGWTSFTVCGKLRRLVSVKKVGHAGTLDPMATGLLIVCVGKATKLADSYQGMIKGYSGVFRLGEATSTWDADSPVIQRESWEHIRDDDIKRTAKSFLGEIWQVPPMFSAIKVNGEKMYDKARRGESIELAPRRISIFQFEIERSLEDRQNLVFRVTCSKGTYIRSLCADLGKALGSCAHLTALRRDSIGEYSADEAWDFKDLEEAITKNYF